MEAADEDVEQRGLAGVVGFDEGEELARARAEADVAEHAADTAASSSWLLLLLVSGAHPGRPWLEDRRKEERMRRKKAGGKNIQNGKSSICLGTMVHLRYYWELSLKLSKPQVTWGK